MQGQAFKGRQFAAEVILWAVRGCLMFRNGTVRLTACQGASLSCWTMAALMHAIGPGTRIAMPGRQPR